MKLNRLYIYIYINKRARVDSLALLFYQNLKFEKFGRFDMLGKFDIFANLDKP